MVLCKFLDEGMLVHTIHEYTQEGKEIYLAQSYHEVSEEDLALYETLRYGYNFETGKPKELPVYDASLEELKKAKLTEAGSLFAQKRDERRFIQLDENRYYGFDCASEDITNFLARWIPLAMMGGGESQYKVWLNETEKDLVMLSLADYNLVYQVVSASQLEAYDWYKVVQTQINACTTKEELEAIVLE